MSEKEILEKFLKFMGKWHYEDFNAFENHFNRLMSMKSKEQLINENEALKDSIAVILAQKKNVHKHCDEKDQQIKRLKQQLAEKDKEIKFLIVDYEKRISQEQELMSNMEHQLTEKQNMIDEINKEFVQAVHDWKALCAKKDEEIEKLKLKLDIRAMSLQNINTERIESERNQTQLAISELEKVKMLTEWKFNSIIDVVDYIDQQINDLRGEKDERI